MRRVAAPPRISLSLAEASQAVGVPPNVLKGEIYFGRLRGKRTGRGRGTRGRLDRGSGQYVVGVADLVAWQGGENASGGGVGPPGRPKGGLQLEPRAGRESLDSGHSL